MICTEFRGNLTDCFFPGMPDSISNTSMILTKGVFMILGKYSNKGSVHDFRGIF